MRNGFAASIAFCLVVAAACPGLTRAEESSALLLPAGHVTLEPDDTLEFVLTAKTNPQYPPVVAAWLLPAGSEKPAANAEPIARTFVAPSPKPGEWLVHARGLKAARGAWDLYVRWAPAANDPDAANGSRGETRLNGAVSIKAEAADVVLLMDGSLSMGRTDPQRLRVGAAREFIEQARRSGSVGRIAIVQFDSKSRTVAALTSVKENFEGYLEKIDERGETDIDGGIRHSLSLLSESGAIVLLTDGKQEPGIYRNAHAEAKKAGVTIHTLALGRDADRELLKRISGETGGTFSDAAKDRDLALAYAAIASRIARVRPILLVENAAQVPPIPVDGACRSLAVSVGGEQSGTLTIAGPRSENWASPAQIAPSYFKDEPASGAWTATWNGPAGSLTAAARTGLYPQFFRADLSSADGEGAVVFDTDEPSLSLSLADSGALMPAQRVEATLVFADNTRQNIALRDDGQNGDLRANDGVFAANIPPLAAGNGSYSESARGIVRVVAEGQRDGLPFRRETQSSFIFRRHLGSALIAGGSLDFGTCFSGETARLEIPLRVRGSGGALTFKLLPPENTAQRDLSRNAELVNAPPQLGPRQNAIAALEISIGQWQDPGLYGGIVEFELTGTGRVRVPWTVRVQSAALRLPARLDLGLLTPGQTLDLRVPLTVDGGRATIDSVELALPWRGRTLLPPVAMPCLTPGIDLMLQSPQSLPQRVTSTVSLISLQARVADDAPGGALEGKLVLRDAARRVLGSIAISGRIASQYLQADLPIQLGPIEGGDKIEQQLRWSLTGHGASNTELSARSKLTLVPDSKFSALHPELSAPAVGNDRGAQATLGLKSTPETRTAEGGGWLLLECGPALIQRRWSATVIKPSLAPTPSALDFGTLAPGKKKSIVISLATQAAKPIPITVRLATPLAKPKLPDIRIDSASLTFALPSEARTVGTPQSLGVSLDLPDSTQDGEYIGSIEIESRLGKISLPARVLVASDIAAAAFHVSPAHVLLRFPEPDAEPPTERLRIVSHRDTDQALVLRMQSEGNSTCAYLLLDPKTDLGTESMTLPLPARATVEISLRAQPNARGGDRSRVTVCSDSEEQSIGVVIERPQAEAKIAVEEPSRLLNWILIFFALLIALVGYLIRKMLKQQWLRYAVYSVLLHAAVLPFFMPKTEMMEALPSSIQITLLEAESDLGMELSEQQTRRLEALQAGDEPPPAVRGQALVTDAQLPAPALPEKKGSDAPSKGEVGKRGAEEARVAAQTLPEPIRTVSQEVSDKPLDAEALSPVEAAPKLLQIAESSVAARSATTLAEHFTDAPLPAAPQRPEFPSERTLSALPVNTASEPAPVRTPVSAPAMTSAIRAPSEQASAFDEAPLQAAPLPQETTTLPAAALGPTNDTVRDIAAHAERDVAGGGPAMLPAPELIYVSQARAGVENSARPVTLAAATTRERNGTALLGSGKSDAVPPASARPSVTSGTGSGLEPLDAPLDSGPRIGGGTKAGAEKVTGEFGGGEGPRTARGVSLMSTTSGAGSLQDFAAALDRSAGIASGHAAPRTGTGAGGLESRGTSDERFSTGRGSGTEGTGTGGPFANGMGTNGQGSGTATGPGSANGTGTGTRPGIEGGWALDGAPLNAGGLGKVAQGDPNGDPRATALGQSGRGSAATVVGNSAGKGGLAQFGSFGPPQIGTTARPGERGSTALRHAPDSASLDTHSGNGTGGGKLTASQKGERLMNAQSTGALLKVNVGLARHSGDWNSSPTALYNLRTAFLERCGLPEVEFKVNTIELSDLKGLLQNRTVLITSNDPIAFKPEELKAMREYMLAGGTLWVNDSSASESNTFDNGFRASIAGLLPGAQLAPLQLEHPFFSACYDLRNGFKGYRVPPGDKYRVNYIEALLTADGRAPLIYTRNDYADGLEIDPRMSAGGKSLTDLTNAEMQEASLRFCLNLVSYSMQGTAPKMPPPPEGAAEFEKVYRYNGPELPNFDDFSVLTDKWQKPVWQAEKEWCNPTEMQIVDDPEMKSKVVRVDFKGGAKFKAAVTRNLPVDFATTRALVADLHSSLGNGFNVALLFYTKDGRSFETRPVFVRPGLNRNVRFPLDMGDMKSSASNPPWKDYDQPFSPRNNVERITLLLYNLGENGAVKIGAIREQK